VSTVILDSASPELQHHLRPIIGAAIADPTAEGDQVRTLIDRVNAVAGAVVIMDSRSDPERAVARSGELTSWYPGLGVLLVSDTPAELALGALRAGVHDIVSPNAELVEFQAAVDRAARAAAARIVPPLVTHPAGVKGEQAAHQAGRIITVVSPKGGVGKTTVATNIAVGVSRSAPNSTVIVDLDIQFGDVASALDLEPEHFLADAVHGAARNDSMVLKTFLTQHPSGLYAICAPNSPAEADLIGPADIRHLLTTLAAEFRYVVLDTPPGLSETTLAALDLTTDLVLVTSMDVPGVRGMRRELDTLAQLGLLVGSHQIVLNFVDNRGLLSVADVEATIGTGVDLLLPRCKAALTSVNLGVPLLQSDGRDPMAKQLRRLVERLTAGDPAIQHGKHKTVETMATGLPKGANPRRAAARWRRTRPVLAS